MGLLILGGIALFFWMCIWLFRALNTEQKERNADPEQTFDELFNGDEHVSYTVGLTSIPYDEVVIGAAQRGYEVLSDSGADKYGTQTLVFKKTAAA